MSESDKEKLNGLTFYKNEYFLLTDRYEIMIDAMRRANVPDIESAMSRINDITMVMNQNIDKFDLDDDFKNEITNLTSSYDKMIKYTKQILKDPESINQKESDSIALNIAESSNRLTDDFFDGAAPTLLGR